MFGKHLTREERKWGIIISLAVLFIFFILQTFLYSIILDSWIFLFSLIPVAIAAWLLGPWPPVFIVPVIHLFLFFTVSYFKGASNYLVGLIYHILIMFVCIGLGMISDLLKKSQLTEKALKSAESKAREANRIKGEFLAGISHEIRSPMNSIIGFAGLLKKELKDDSQIKKLDIIINAGNSLLDLINDLLDFSKIEAGKIELSLTEFSLKELLQPVKNLFSIRALEKRLNFNVVIDPAVPAVVKGDQRRIQQVLINLVNNAIKFTDAGSVSVLCTYLNDKAVITVKDTGIGIPKDMQELIFEAFQQVNSTVIRRQEGTGLGLSISKKLIELMRGTISLQSITDEGSTFTLKIPLPAVEAPLKKTDTGMRLKSRTYIDEIRKLIKRTPGYSLRVLGADKDIRNRELIKSYLEEVGVPVDFAVNGKQLQDLLKLSEHTGSPYDMLLIDSKMPLSDSLEVTRDIKDFEPFRSLCIIAMTQQDEDTEKYLATSCDSIIVKPVQREELYKELHGLILQKYYGGKTFPLDGIQEEIPEEELPEESKTPELGRQLLSILKKNTEIFNPGELILRRDMLKRLLPPHKQAKLLPLLDRAIEQYDDDLLNDIIKELETFLGIK